MSLPGGSRALGNTAERLQFDKGSAFISDRNVSQRDPFEYYSSRDPEGACEVAKRALLSQGYQVDESKPRNIRGEKYFRPKTDEATRLSIILVCLPSNLGTVIYASGLETQFEMKSKGAVPA